MPGEKRESKTSSRKERDSSRHRERKSKAACSPCSAPCPPPPCPPCPQECPSFDVNTACPTVACKPQKCKPCPQNGPSCPPPPCPPQPPCPSPCPDKRQSKWCNLLPKGFWCDTMSCLIPCDKVHCITPELKVRVNLYCAPFMDVVTANGVPMLGAMQLPPMNFNVIVNQMAKNTCSLACPVVLNVYEKLKTYPQLSTLVQAIDSSESVREYLSSCATTATLFAPTNEAFEEAATAAGYDSVEEFVQYLIATEYSPEINLLTALLLNHTLPKVVFAAAYKPGQSTKVLNKLQECLQVFKFSAAPYSLCVTTQTSEKAQVLTADILATNGTVFIVNKVLTI